MIVAAAFAGARIAPATLLEVSLKEELDIGTAKLLLGRQATTRAAALINGAAAHAAEFDDIYRDGIYHPGAPTIAAKSASVGSSAGPARTSMPSAPPATPRASPATSSSPTAASPISWVSK